MEASPLYLETSTSQLGVHDLELGSEHGSSAGSEPDFMDATESKANDADTVGRPSPHDSIVGRDSHDQDLDKLHLTAVKYAREEKLAPGTYVNGQNLMHDEVVNAPPDSIRTGTDKDHLEQDIGPGRQYHQLGACSEAQGPGAEEAIVTHANVQLIPNKVNASWGLPEESISEIGTAIQRLDENLVAALDPTTSNHPPVTNTTLHGTSEEELAAHFSAAQDKHSPTEEVWDASAPSSSAARQARVHLHKSSIHRMRQTTGIISFKVDKRSFRKARVSKKSIKRVIHAGRRVAHQLTTENLGITFAYAPDSDRKVFRICCDPSLRDGVLAAAFFPSDPRERWKLRISPRAVKKSCYRKDPHYLERIIAHEFMHILGFRHWNAGSDKDEKLEESVLWPGTVDGNRNTIMLTSIDKSLWLSQEDRKVIRELYLKPTGALVRPRLGIRDVDPYNRR